MIERCFLSRAATAALLLLLGAAPSLARADERRPNSFETAYTAMALDLGAHELCDRISFDAVSRFLFNSRGTQAYRERSRCFLYVAVNTQNETLCSSVIEEPGWVYSGSYFSRENCEAMISAGTTINFTLSFDQRLVLTELGYTQEDMARSGSGDPADDASWHMFYLNALKDEASLRERFDRAPDFSAPAP